MNIKLRDHFAGLAMQSIMQSEHLIETAIEYAAIKKIELQEAIADFSIYSR